MNCSAFMKLMEHLKGKGIRGRNGTLSGRLTGEWALRKARKWLIFTEWHADLEVRTRNEWEVIPISIGSIHYIKWTDGQLTLKALESGHVVTYEFVPEGD